uniref:UPAR/Ly6 domain-containing protein n=1 Tax=Panagrolaimus sp. ES5 TaxID=591445 RepID=A0AC34FKW2_9BILA
MMKIFFVLVVLAFCKSVESIHCVYAINDKIIDANHACPSTDTFCSTVILSYNDSQILHDVEYVSKRQGCGIYMSWLNNGQEQQHCTSVGHVSYRSGITDISATCCNTNLCNAAPQPPPCNGATTKTFSFIGFLSFVLFIIIA